jgi:LMBR1 domain-containing protein 1
MIKGRQRIDAEGEDVENRLTATRERQRVLRSKYINRTMPNRDQREIEELEDEER